MKYKFKARKISFNLCLSLIFVAAFAAFADAQTKTLIKRTTYKTEAVDFGAGGTFSIVGAPNGSISIEGWQKNEVEISADIEVQAENEVDLNQLSQITGFVLDEGFGHISVQTVGAHDKKYIKKAAKKLPKNLLSMPFRIDYRVKVPAFCDLDINGGSGDLSISNIDGGMLINFLESNATLNLIGGAVSATFGKGDVSVVIPSQKWRGRFADVQVASGNLTVRVPQNLNADFNAKILRSGKIENSFAALKPRDRAKFTEQAITARAGNGGITLNFTVGDGTLKIQN